MLGKRKGGKRPGSPKTGGRKKGTPNKKSLIDFATIAAKRHGKPSPLEYLLQEMDAPYPPHLTFEKKMMFRQFKLSAASAAANYMHARLASIKVQEIPAEQLPGDITPDDPRLFDIARRIAFVMALGAKQAEKQEKLVRSEHDRDEDGA